MTVKLSYNYFLHPEKDGNLSLPTTESRISDASKLLTSGTVIQFEEDEKIASSTKELETLIQNFKTSNDSHMYKNGQKIYYQDDHVIIGSKVWDFLQGQSNDSLYVKRDKHIPVQAISSVDFVDSKIGMIICILLAMASIFGAFLLWSTGWMYSEGSSVDTIVCICLGGLGVLIFALLAKYLHDRGTLKILTNNIMSMSVFPFIKKDIAQKYMKPMLQCLRERQLA